MRLIEPLPQLNRVRLYGVAALVEDGGVVVQGHLREAVGEASGVRGADGGRQVGGGGCGGLFLELRDDGGWKVKLVG